MSRVSPLLTLTVRFPPTVTLSSLPTLNVSPPPTSML
jgi:hypothetical protein